MQKLQIRGGEFHFPTDSHTNELIATRGIVPLVAIRMHFKTFSLFRSTAMITIHIVKLTLLFNNLPQLFPPRSCEGNLKKKASKKDISFTRANQTNFMLDENHK